MTAVIITMAITAATLIGLVAWFAVTVTRRQEQRLAALPTACCAACAAPAAHLFACTCEHDCGRPGCLWRAWHTELVTPAWLSEFYTLVPVVTPESDDR